ncbi:MAG: efflux RND transporter permease subunit [Elusimicrobiota bacterium]
MIRSFVKRPAMTLMFVLVFVVLGLVSFNNLVIKRNPDTDFPMVSVRTVYSGASPEEIESQILRKIEDAVSAISQIDKIRSTAYENYGFVMIEFDLGVDVNNKAMEVKDKIQPILNELPQDAQRPVVAKFDPMTSSIMDMVLTGENVDERELYEYADKELRDEFSIVEGVASVDVYGGRKRQINVELDNNLMKKHFISIGKVVSSLQGRNVNIPGGAIERSENKSSVRLIGEFEEVEDIRNMSLVTWEGQRIKLSDIGTVSDSFEEKDSYTRYNGKNVVGLSIKKMSGGDAVSIVERIRNELGNIRENLPKNMELAIAYDSTRSIIRDTTTTVKNIIYGILFTVLILFLFLGDVRTTIIAAVVIPTSIISAFFPVDFSGFSINFVTLLAVAISLGTLIANALVIIDSIDLHLQKGKNPEDAAVDGTREASVAVLAAAGTNLVVFTPIALMGGMVGQFMTQLGMTVVYATVFSILASFTLTPMMCAILLKPRQEEKKYEELGILKKIIFFPQKVLQFLLKEYKVLFNKLFKHPVLTIVGCAAVFASVFYPLKFIGNEFFPPSDQDRISIEIQMPQGTKLEKTLEKAKIIENHVKEIKEVTSYLSYVGVDGAETAEITVNLKPVAEREKSDLDIINNLIPKVAKIPDAKISFGRGGMGPGTADVTINVHGQDYDRLVEMANEMKGLMMDTGYFRSVESSYNVPANEIRFIPDDEKIIRYGVSNRQVGDILRSAVEGNDRNVYREKGEEYDINIELAEIFKKSSSDIADINIMSKDGLITLSQLGKVIKTRGRSTINRRDKKRVIKLSGFLSKGTAGEVRALLDNKFSKKMDFGKEYGYNHVGMAEMQRESEKEIKKAFILAVILTYMLLVAILNSFIQPFVIVTSVITSFMGVFYLLFFMDFSVNIGSMMAMVMVVGLVVNNAILLIDYALKEMSRGKDMKEALWSGASVKFRTILMTSLAIVFGALPQLFDNFGAKAAMGGVIIGGMLASIFFTFTLIPVVFKEALKFQHFVVDKIKAIVR